MSLKILHTADWHIGQTFYEYDRSFEHSRFLSWITDVITDNQIDVLLISGDIFDVSNPSAASMRLFYGFLKDVIQKNPSFQIICTAGNHDSAARLEAPAVLLEAFNTIVVGSVVREPGQGIQYENITIPLRNKSNDIVAWCLAVPYLRPGDYPAENGYAAGIEQVYNEGIAYSQTVREPGQAIIAMGHLHTLDAKITEDDKSERKILGGLEFIPVSAFSEEISYTALGHIHRPQIIGGRENVRYAGSPLPMSFSEINYLHQVVLVEIDGENLAAVTPIPIPVSVKLQSVPHTPKPIHEVLAALARLPDSTGENRFYPFLQVRVMLEGPEPSLRHQVEEILKKKAVRLAKIEVSYPFSEADEKPLAITADDLQKLSPADMFERKYKSLYNQNIPEEIFELFNEVLNSLETNNL